MKNLPVAPRVSLVNYVNLLEIQQEDVEVKMSLTLTNDSNVI